MNVREPRYPLRRLPSPANPTSLWLADPLADFSIETLCLKAKPDDSWGPIEDTTPPKTLQTKGQPQPWEFQHNALERRAFLRTGMKRRLSVRFHVPLPAFTTYCCFVSVFDAHGRSVTRPSNLR